MLHPQILVCSASLHKIKGKAGILSFRFFITFSPIVSFKDVVTIDGAEAFELPT